MLSETTSLPYQTSIPSQTSMPETGEAVVATRIMDWVRLMS